MGQSRDPTSIYSAFPLQRGLEGSSSHLPFDGTACPFAYGRSVVEWHGLFH